MNSTYSSILIWLLANNILAEAKVSHSRIKNKDYLIIIL